MVHAFDKVITAGGEAVFGIHIHAADRVDDLDEGCEVYSRVVADIDAVDALQRRHGHVHAVDTRVGQLVPLLPGYARDRYVVVAGCGRQEDLVRVRVHRHDDIYIAPAVRCDRTRYVDTADIDIEGFILCDDVRLFLYDLGLDAVLVDDAHLVGISLDAFIDDACERLVVDGRPDLSVEERLRFLLDGRIVLHIRRLADNALHVLEHLLVVLLVEGGLHAERIVLDVDDILRRVVRAHDNDHVVGLVARAADLFEHPAGAEHIVASEPEGDADQHAEDDAHDEHFALQELQPEHHAEEDEQRHRQDGDVRSGDHAACPHSRDEDQGHQKLDEDDQLARQVAGLRDTAGISAVRMAPLRVPVLCMSSRM